MSGGVPVGAKSPIQTRGSKLASPCEGRRLVERTPHAGVRVVQLSLEDLEQLLATRESLEGMACRQAAENMTAAEIRQLRETAARIGKML